MKDSDLISGNSFVLKCFWGMITELLKYCLSNCLFAPFFLSFSPVFLCHVGFQKVAQDCSLTWRRPGRWAFTTPSTHFCVYPYLFFCHIFISWILCAALFVCFSVQSDPLFGLLGFGGGMDFDSDKAYRWYRDAAPSSLQLFHHFTSIILLQLISFVETDLIPEIQISCFSNIQKILAKYTGSNDGVMRRF